MAQESGRNVQQPEYLNEKDAAEDRENAKERDREPAPDEQRKRERAINSVVNKTFGH